jgi:hypothetical protein
VECKPESRESHAGVTLLKVGGAPYTRTCHLDLNVPRRQATKEHNLCINSRFAVACRVNRKEIRTHWTRAGEYTYGKASVAVTLVDSGSCLRGPSTLNIRSCTWT